MSYKNQIIKKLDSAVKALYSGSKLIFSEITDSGLYCDFMLSEPINPKSFLALQNEMNKLSLQNEINAPVCLFELSSFSGVYMDGDSNKPMLQRIYVIAFEKIEEFNDYKEYLKTASLHDHKRLGDQLSLYSSSEDIGQGLILWHPNGAMVRLLLEQYAQKMNILNGYSWVYSPHIGKAELWKTSGHLENYADVMYNPIRIENDEYYLKPMSCPFHIAIYNSEARSYRELPIRYAEFGTVYRYELSGALNGLTRVRGFTQDDAHIFCTPEQIEEELTNTIKLSLHTLASFGLTDYRIYVSTKPESKAIGKDADWDAATEILKKAVINLDLSFDIDEGGGAFYGPKVDIKLFDSLGREWQCSTIQFDFNLPERFNVTYIGSDGKSHTPYMVHRALFGSLERFMALLTEHYMGAFPLWYAPVQVGIVPINSSHNEFCKSLMNQLQDNDLRVETNFENKNMRDKIKRFEQQKIPFILIIGDRDITASCFSIRSRQDGDLGQMDIEHFLKFIEPELKKGKARRLIEA